MQCELSVARTHGVSTWARLHEIGTRLAASTGAVEEAVRLFAVFHDSRRCNEGHDAGHGKRGAELAALLRGGVFEATNEELELRRDACVRHTAGETDADVTVQTCWDSNRLDLGRVGIKSDPRRLCTPAARDPDVIEWAYHRSIRPDWPRLILDEWGVEVTRGW